MAGVYVHIPYCKVKCHYCDFHFSTNSSSANDMIEAICLELNQRKDYLANEKLTTIYFGGGTPSLLSNSQVEQILSAVHSNFQVDDNVEITLEANPDDLDKAKLTEFRDAGVNRLSIGIQSFDDEVLKRMNRAHNSQEASECVKLAQDVGFENITTDLIYGVPDKGVDYWKEQLDRMLELNVPHISSYCLTIESNTVFGHQNRYGELKVPDDETTLEQFRMMVDMLRTNGYQHYEISNFAKEGFISEHNSAYWLGKKYLGVGPSAHSYNGENRGWNVSNNPKYIEQVFENSSYHETEVLTERDKFNDYILTRLRTQWGIDLDRISTWEEDVNLVGFTSALEKHLELQNVIKVNQVVRLSDHGKFIADRIASDLFV